MTKYQYEEGKVYTSESEPITINRIPSGTYKVIVTSDSGDGECILTTGPGTQRVSITTLANDWDLSGLVLTWTGYEEDRLDGAPVTLTVSGITGSFPECATCAIVTTYNSTGYVCTVSDNNPNSSWSFIAGQAVTQTMSNTATFVLRDADGNTIVETTEYTAVNNLQ